MEPVVNNILLMLQAGPRSASDLAARLKIDQSNVSRYLNGALKGQVLKIGAGRSTRWGLLRHFIDQKVLLKLPIYRVTERGGAVKIAHLSAIYPLDNYVVEYFRDAETESPTPEWAVYESLPWWLTDMRPQGFLGRSFAQLMHKIDGRMSTDPRTWGEDQILYVLAHYPQDTIGNLLIGEQAYQTWLQEKSPVAISPQDAAIRADAIVQGEHFESSAQGEQPKFIAVIKGINSEGMSRKSVESIIKFSGAVTAAEAASGVDTVANRWADLLHVEALSSKVLNQAMPGIAALNTSFRAGSRTFMASKRFDRLANGGRVGVISLSSLDAEFVGQANSSWPTVMAVLAAEKIVSEEALQQTKMLWAFGQLIANTDMHFGNLSVLNKSGRPYSLAPVYDMLPMYYAPSSAGDVPQYSERTILTNSEVKQEHWQLAHGLALSLWQQVLEHEAISPHFKTIGAQQLIAVQEFAAVIKRMV